MECREKKKDPVDGMPVQKPEEPAHVQSANDGQLGQRLVQGKVVIITMA